MQIPKVSRLGPPNALYEITYDDDIVPEAKGSLIDFAQVNESTKIPITTKYWKSNAGSTGGFEKLRFAIDEVSRLSGADIVLEESNSRIRVSSYLDSSIVDDAMNRLSNLQPCLVRASLFGTSRTGLCYVACVILVEPVSLSCLAGCLFVYLFFTLLCLNSLLLYLCSLLRVSSMLTDSSLFQSRLKSHTF